MLISDLVHQNYIGIKPEKIRLIFVIMDVVDIHCDADHLPPTHLRQNYGTIHLVYLEINNIEHEKKKKSGQTSFHVGKVEITR